jgi:threo-3-hydroxy-L-aspartate ammonia-lyase
MITFSDIEAADRLLEPVVHRTPLLSSTTFNTMTGSTVYFKAENFQRIGAFKFRGAYNKISSLTDAQRQAGVIAHSSGNHAQGVALASKLFGIRATIVMPENSVPGKVAAARGYGAEIVFCGTSTDDRERVTQELIDRHGYTLIHPYNDPVLIAGQGTAALEISRQISRCDVLVVPVGGGGLISGCAVAAKHCFPGIRVIGVETEGANDCAQSFRLNRIVKIPKADTIADGMRTLSVGSLNFEIIRNYVDDIITIRDEEIIPMMKFFIERMKVVVEPTGAVAPAAVMSGKISPKGAVICAMISGGNVDTSFLRSIL